MRISTWVPVVAGVALAMSATACNNDKLTSLNKDPNNPTDVLPGPLFTNAVQNGVARWLGATSANLRGTEFIIQHQTEDQYSDEDRYVRIDPNTTQGLFTFSYQRELQDLKRVASKGAAAGEPGIYGPALVLQSWEFANLTNTFGNVPYSQALKGDSGVFKPAYDAQKDIYAGMFTTLSKAAADMASDTKGVTLGGADPIYGGDETAWQRFANSLHARLALMLVNVDRATADAELKAAFAGPGGVFQSNADNAKLPWPGDGVFNNPWSDFFQTRDDNRMSRTFMNILIANSDPRLAVFAQPSASTYADCVAAGKCVRPASDTATILEGTMNGQTYFGEPNGLTTANATTWNRASRVGFVFYPGANVYGAPGGGPGASTPSYLMTYAELSFIQAEAAERGLGGLTAAQAAGFYNAGIRASMEQWGVTDQAAINAYIASPAVAYQGGTAGLRQIALQKYIALFADGTTTWAEWRRTCVPGTIQPGPAASLSFVPRRFMFPPTEYSVNPDNVNKAKTDQGGDGFDTRVYFDSNPSAAPTCP